MKVTIEVQCCNDCPHYVIEDDEDCNFGAMHYCREGKKSRDIIDRNIIPDWCPILKKLERKITKSKKTS